MAFLWRVPRDSTTIPSFGVRKIALRYHAISNGTRGYFGAETISNLLMREAFRLDIESLGRILQSVLSHFVVDPAAAETEWLSRTGLA